MHGKRCYRGRETAIFVGLAKGRRIGFDGVFEIFAVDTIVVRSVRGFER